MTAQRWVRQWCALGTHRKEEKAAHVDRLRRGEAKSTHVQTPFPCVSAVRARRVKRDCQGPKARGTERFLHCHCPIREISRLRQAHGRDITAAALLGGGTQRRKETKERKGSRHNDDSDGLGLLLFISLLHPAASLRGARASASARRHAVRARWLADALSLSGWRWRLSYLDLSRVLSLSLSLSFAFSLLLHLSQAPAP